MSTRAPSRVEKEIPVFQFLKDTNPSSGQLASKLDSFGKQTKKTPQNQTPPKSPSRPQEQAPAFYYCLCSIKDTEDKLVAFS